MGKNSMKSNAKRHPHAGKHFIVETGKLKGLTVKIADYLQNQFQGKSIKALSQRADIAPMIAQLKGRGFEVTENTLYAFGPDKMPLLLDDTEIQVQAKPKLKSIDGGKDDSGETSGEDSGASGSEGHEGRSVPSGEADSEVTGESDEAGQSDSEVGGGEGSSEPTSPRPDKPKAGSGTKDTQARSGNRANSKSTK